MHPVAVGMLTDGFNTINTRWLAKAAECVWRAQRTKKCQVLQIVFHPMPCKHGRGAIP